MKYLLLCLVVLFPITSFAEIDQTVPYTIATMAQERGVDVWQALYISWNESQWDCDAEGDGHTSMGCWQIHLPAHPTVSVTQAKNLIWSTTWSMNQLALGHCKIWSTCPDTRR